MMPLKSRKEDERLRESDHQTEELSFTYKGSSQYNPLCLAWTFLNTDPTSY